MEFHQKNWEKLEMIQNMYRCDLLLFIVGISQASQVVLVVKNPPANSGDIRDLGLILESGRSPRGGNGNPLQYSCLENSMDRSAWWVTVHGLAHTGMHWSFMVVGVPQTLYVELLVLQLVLRRKSTEQADDKRKIGVEWGKQEIQPVHPKGNQSWMFIGRTDTEAETPILWPPDANNWPIGKDPDAGKDRRQEEKRPTEDEMVGWHHRLNGHEFEETPGVGNGQGSLACCSPWGCKDLDTTEWLNWTELREAGMTELASTNQNPLSLLPPISSNFDDMVTWGKAGTLHHRAKHTPGQDLEKYKESQCVLWKLWT